MMKVEYKNIRTSDDGRWEFGERWVDEEFSSTFCRLLVPYTENFENSLNGLMSVWQDNGFYLDKEMIKYRRDYFATLSKHQRIEMINHMKQRGSNLYGDEDYLINSLDPKLVTCYKTVKSQVNFNKTR